MKKFLVCTILVIFLAGCNSVSDYIEPENRVMVSALGLDFINNEILITAECIDINTTDNKDSFNLMAVTANGNTFQNAVTNLNTKIDGKLFLNQCPVLLLGDGFNLKVIKDIFENSIKTQVLPLGIHLVCCDNANQTISANTDKKPAGYQLMSLLHFGKNTLGITDDDSLLVIANSINQSNTSFKLPKIKYSETYEVIGCRYFNGKTYYDFNILKAQLLYLINNDLKPCQIIVKNQVLDYKNSSIDNNKIKITLKNYNELDFVNETERELRRLINNISKNSYKVKLTGVK